jgi:hypothetical protein
VLAWAAGRPPRLGRSISRSEAVAESARAAVTVVQAELLTAAVVGRLRAAADCAPASLAEITGDDACARLGEALDRVVYPGWPDIVDYFHTHVVELFTPAVEIRRQTDEVLELLAVAEAQARAAGRPEPLETEFAGHPATRLYLGPAWSRIMRAVGDPLTLPRSDARERESALLDQGRQALLEMWEQLGMYIGVGELDVEFRGRPRR